ncbi:YbjN domain-containing protein [Sphingomonas sp. HITSZ_GF]|uniref:YbjN domain-containing protein n=1 Tax=Sphingomonas sp. HITSZ_GF TaxID=3037247 RepID=UPI00240E7CAA|nr:YbjN domain-containing protein [Sphingomonas sp. HITSZ_GF]MDG2532675.1 YbjN domain-containing protein [Sphingomonas sp. HITSZ_GF]
MRTFLMVAGLVVSAWAMPAAAQNQVQAPCAKDQVCANAPQTVLAAMEKAGLKPKMTTDGQGDPMIESDEAVYHFDVYFYGCDDSHKNCDSLRFEVLFEKAPENTPEFANKWNKGKRFLQAFIRDDGQMGLAYDLAMIGGLNQRNFADVLDWWDSQLGELGKFFKAELNLPDKPAEKK